MRPFETARESPLAVGLGRLASAACFVALAVSVVACDPFWTYHARSGHAVQSDGLRYDIPSENPKVRVHAFLFLNELQVELTLTNEGTQPLTLVAAELQASDARRVPLSSRAPGRWSCAMTDNVLVITPGAACTVARTFTVEPHDGCFPSGANPDLAQISVRLTTAEPKLFADIGVLMDR